MQHKVYRSLTDPILFLGVPFQFFIGLGFAALLMIVLTTLIIIPALIAVSGYIIAVAMTKKDSCWLQILLIASKHRGIDNSNKGTTYVA
tara:strand:- start:26942 stop:27208 length:267 start_codon:yes stop_codon:yes gene_type:complete